MTESNQSEALALIDESTLRRFREDGVVCLRGAFTGAWLEVVHRGFEHNLAYPGPRAQIYAAGSDSAEFFMDADRRHFVNGPFVPGENRTSAAPRFYNDCTTWRGNPDYRRFIFESPASAIAMAMLGTRQVHLFFEDILVKESGADAPTPWHQDVPVWPIEGRRVCSLWMPLDPVDTGNGVEFIRGSHHGKPMLDMSMADPECHYGADLTGYSPLPNFAADLDERDVIDFKLEPGDCLDGHIVHGARTRNVDRLRRTFATRWAGEGCVFAPHKHRKVSPPFPYADVAPGARLGGEAFPLVRGG